MKKVSVLILVVMLSVVCLSLIACTSDSPVVGTYKLVSVYMDNGREQKNFVADGTNPSVTENSFTLVLKKNYRWTMNIMLPGLTEQEDGKWTEDDDAYALIEDRDEPEIALTFNGDIVNFTMSDNGYVMNVTLIKQK